MGFPWASRGHETSGVPPVARKSMVTNGKKIAFGDTAIAKDGTPD